MDVEKPLIFSFSQVANAKTNRAKNAHSIFNRQLTDEAKATVTILSFLLQRVNIFFDIQHLHIHTHCCSLASETARMYSFFLYSVFLSTHSLVFF